MTPLKDLGVGFAGANLTGGLLPTPPPASTSGEPTDFLAARFTTKSALCVTGLVVDSGTCYSSLEQIIIVALIQVAGPDLMGAATLLLLPMGRRIILSD